MSIVYCQSFLLEIITTGHNFASDVIKLALFTQAAAPDYLTTAYSTTNELASGSGYTTGGNTLALTSTYPKIEDNAACARFESSSWTFTADVTFRYALMYNSSKSNKAILSIDFGRSRSYRNAFTVNFPLAANAIIRQVAPTSAL